MEALPIAVFWCLAACSCFWPPHVLLYLLFATLPLMAFATVPTSATGGFTLTSTSVFTMLMVGRRLLRARSLRRMLDIAWTPSAGLAMFLFWALAGIVTLFMPRVFEGRVQVINLSNSELRLLDPTLQNATQMGYMTLSVLSVFVFADLLRAPDARRHAMQALCLGAAVTCLTGWLDYASQFLPLTPLLDLMRTASYAMLTADEILGSKRIVGLTPEASAFGSIALGFLSILYFFRRAMPAGTLRDLVVPPLMVSLLLLTVLCTSSSAYLGLCVLAALATAEWCWRAAGSRRNAFLRRGLLTELCVFVAGTWFLLLLAVAAAPHSFDPLLEMLDVMVLQKTNSLSYLERSMWTQVSWQALLATYGLGVGLGGTRTSNIVVALASNAGLLGTACYFAFIAQCLLLRRTPRGDAEGHALLWALRWSYVPPFAASVTVATTPDFGLFSAFFYGLSIALTHRRSCGAAGPGTCIRP